MKNIAVFTCNRADEGPMGPVVKALEARADVRVCRVGPGLHTYADPSRFAWFLCLGDRHELLPACHGALLNQVPIAHIHGGETTLGSFDDRVRNAVSQLASLHFTAAEMFSQRLSEMKVPGEIFTVGPPGLDDLETDDTSEFGSGFFLVCLHPDTTRDEAYNRDMALALSNAMARHQGRRIVWVGPNNDPGSEPIRYQFKRMAHTVMAAESRYFDTLSRRAYLTALKHAAVCIGNSSSFVIEAPALGTPTVLVGDRQKGRPLAEGIFTAAPDAGVIASTIRTQLEWRYGVRFVGHAFPPRLPYGHGGASTKIARVLAEWQS